jgi:hypothetical protein
MVSPLALGVCASVPGGVSAKLTAASSIRPTIATAISSRFLWRLKKVFPGQLIASVRGGKSRTRIVKRAAAARKRGSGSQTKIGRGSHLHGTGGRLGGCLTGSRTKLGAKALQLLKEAWAGLSRVAVLCRTIDDRVPRTTKRGIFQD